MDAVEVYAIGLCNCSVCTSMTDVAEIERIVNATHPTGVSPWRISNAGTFSDGTPMPGPCEENPERKHYLLSC